jgi:tetratricopeptide (TPR) repeat protein
MIDQKRASNAARQGFDLWMDEKPDQAVALYEEALRFADPMHYGLPEYHGEFAQVLNILGRHVEALEQLKNAIAAQLRSDTDEFSNGVAIHRYFLGQFYLDQNRPLDAIGAVAPSLKEGADIHWLLLWVRALAFQALGRDIEASVALAESLQNAPSDEKRQELANLFAESAKSAT